MRIHKLPFIPYSQNFSTLPEGIVNGILGATDESEEINHNIDKEILLVKSLSFFNSDKERCILLLEILREYGFQLDYGSIAQSLKIQLRWLMRIKANMRKKVKEITVNDNL
ncbi:MAG TPA: hypothetical protein VEL70_01785 [Candidatus Acidoferrum sp.]|nr:hypothetical protein [Candidatus Acidoferrum sp.]